MGAPDLAGRRRVRRRQRIAGVDVGAPTRPRLRGRPDGGHRRRHPITIKDFAYGDPLTVAPGAAVTVTNMDAAAHTVTADEGSAFDAQVKGGGTATFTAPTKPGSYAYHCTYHPGMHGTLVVK